MIAECLKKLRQKAVEKLEMADSYQRGCLEGAIQRIDAVLCALDAPSNPSAPIHREIHDILILLGEGGVFD